MRAFAALELDPSAIAAFACLAEHLRARPNGPSSPLAWTPEPKMHLTLKFFGELEEARVPEVAGVLERLVAGRAPPRARVKELTAFPAQRRATVIVVELEGAGLAELAEEAEAAFEAMGVPREQRPFRGHVTLARSRSPFDARAWLASVPAPAGEWSATELVLFESKLGKGGSVYTARVRHGWA